MKRILIISILLVCCCILFSACNAGTLSDEDIFERHLKAVSDFEATDSSHYQARLIYEFDGEDSEEFIWNVWCNGQNSYTEAVASDGTAQPATLVYAGNVYSYSANTWILNDKLNENVNLHFDATAERISCSANDIGYTVTTKADWLKDNDMGVWRCNSAQITYTYDTDWTLVKVQITSELTPDPNSDMYSEDITSGKCTQICDFLETPEDEIISQIESIWQDVSAQKNAS